MLQSQFECTEQASTSPRPGDGRAHVKVRTCDFVSNCSEPVTGVVASLCNKKDVHCAHPLRRGIMDADGVLSFDVPTRGELGDGFDGYLKLSAPLVSCHDVATFGESSAALCKLAPECEPGAQNPDCRIPTFAPALLFFNPPIRDTPKRSFVVPLIPTASIGALVGAAGGEFDARAGHIFLTARDCTDAPASDVSFTLSENTSRATPLYLRGGVISDSATHTDASGLGGFLNVTPGFAEIIAAPISAPAQPFGVVGVMVEPFAITYVDLIPSD